MLIQLAQWRGEIPILQPDQLPPGAARLSSNCDYSHGDVRGVRGAVIAGTTIGPGLYSDGVRSLGSADRYLDACKSPVIGDTHNRYYFSNSSGGLRVTTAASMGSGLNFSAPGASYKVGVPAPESGLFEVKAAQKDAVLDGLKWKIWSFYEKNGVQFQKTLIHNSTGDGDAIVQASFRFDEQKWVGWFDMPAISSATMPAEAVAELPKLTGQITGLTYEKESSSAIGSLEAENTDNTSPTATTTTTEEFAAATATALDGHTVSVNGKEYTKVSQYRDVNGGWHDLNQAVIDYNASLLTSASASGDGVTAQVLIEGYDATRGGAKVITIYSLGSSLHTQNVTSRLVGGVDCSVEHAPDAEQGPAKRTYKFAIHWGIRDSRAYAFTFVNLWGEEGPPSEAYSVDVTYVQWATLKMKRAPNASGYAPVEKLRVYRAQVAAGGAAAFQFVAEVTLADVQVGKGYAEDKAGEQLGEVLPSWDKSRTGSAWEPPPDDCTGVCLMQSNFNAAWRSGTGELCFSEPLRPWAWPARYRVSVPNPIVTAMPHAGGLLVLTTAEPWFVSGNHPDALAAQMIPARQGCVGRRAAVNRGDSIMYASNDGIVSVVGMQAAVASRGLYTRDRWRQQFGAYFGAADFELVEHDGWLIAYSASGAFAPVSVRLDEGGGSVTRLPNLTGALSGFTLPQTDGLYFATGSTVQRFADNASGRLAWSHTTGYLTLPHPVTFSAIEIRASGAVTVKVYADDALTTTVTTAAHEIFRLPAGFKSKRWHLEISGAADAVLYSINLATSVAELKQAA